MADYNYHSNVGVQFFRGLQQNLNNIGTTGNPVVKDGAFYLTTDTNRLYVGQNQSLVELNKSVTIVDKMVKESGDAETLTYLPIISSENSDYYDGQFYYVSNKNILCVYKKSEKKWVQINPDTNTELTSDDKNTTVSQAGGIVTVANSVGDNNGHTSSGSFTITGGSNVTVSADANNNITIDAVDTTYDLNSYSSGTAKGLQINDSDRVEFTAALEGDTDDVASLTVTQENGKIGYSLKVDNMYNTGVEVSSEDSGFKVIVKDNGGDKEGSFDPAIKYGKTPETVKFEKGTATLDVYTTSEVDSILDAKFQAADAMRYCGTVGLNSSDGATTTFNEINADASKIAAGDTYKVAASGKYEIKITNNEGEATYTFSEELKAGDLLIALEDGVTKWSFVPSGEDQVFTTNFDASNNAWTLVETTGGDFLSHKIVAGSQMTVTSSDNEEQGSNGNITKEATQLITTITHGTITTTKSSIDDAADVTIETDEAAKSFEAITGITLDNGHVTNITSNKITLQDTHNHITGTSLTSTDIDEDATNPSLSGVNIEVGITTSDGDEGKIQDENIQTLSLQSNTLKMSSNATATTIELVWGTF